jgi:hypothetical protein
VNFLEGFEMEITERTTAIANDIRAAIQDVTKTISEGEGVAMFLLWTFYMEHVEREENVEIEELARYQLEEFMKFAKDNIHIRNLN